ncbi:gastric triacylglycerol lipase-like [Acropora millepora]|uniref:gastric triacylglycerol lipase-like n=1 Tax=Acropora millepora TaxID=45264 RepID=UPI001CF34F78|nr:gastric triacylglycerol lipase-like [Acropora millepora]
MSAKFLAVFFSLFFVAETEASELQLKYRPNLPEANMNVIQMIRYYGYPAEEYTVKTDDGYLLNIHRIPPGEKRVQQDCSSGSRSVVFLQHGLLSTSSDWITNLPNQSLGFILADAGFDVWMGNVRGNTYGLRHIKFPLHSDQFWNFSWDEIARYDIPAMLKFVTRMTSQSSLYYVGYSQGTTIAFAEFSRNKIVAKMVKTFFALAPVTTVGNTKGATRLLSNFSPLIKDLFKSFHVRDFLPSNSASKWLAQDICSKEDFRRLCSNALFIISGFDKEQLNETRLPVYLSHTPAGTSAKNILHWLQMIKSRKFQMYDYGWLRNLKRYGQLTPPKYNVSAMTVPVAVYWAQNDWLADPTDVRALLLQLPNKLYDKYITKWNHMDFIWAMDAATRVYKDIIKKMRTC